MTMDREIEHTPGPWKAEGPVWGDAEAMVFTASQNDAIAAVYHKQDAHLIAAAPELLEAAKEAVNEVGRVLYEIRNTDGQLGTSQDERIVEALDDLHTAIAKAEGT